MRPRYRSLSALIAAGLAVLVVPTQAAEFKKAEDCVAGLRVIDREGRSGTVSGANGSTCKVKRDDTGKDDYYIFWMLRTADGKGGSPAQVKAGKSAAVAPAGRSGNSLPTGLYPCYSLAGATLNYAFIDIRIDGPDRYRDKQGAAGRYVLKDDGRIVFESGPLAKATAKLLAGPRIGLNMDGGSFYNTSCSLKK